ncbi:MAG: hypothetical protein MUE33_07320 [Cytophagaceae bacterium]|jgi:hypothetical protein|nr:hypothetical protein [Cytophagaceae bacterium]
MDELERQLLELCVNENVFVTVCCSTAHKGFVKDIVQTIRKFTHTITVRYVGEMRSAAEVRVGKKTITVG